MTEGNLAYYARRAREEAEAAAATDQPRIASAHLMLAIQYEDLVRELRGGNYNANRTRLMEPIDG